MATLAAGGCACAAVIAAVRMKLRRGGVLRAAPCGPLTGVRVVDLSVVVAGPWSTELLSEMGAEVIKVECKDLPDSARALGTAPVPGMAGCAVSTSRGKQSIMVNLKSEKGLEVFMRLVKKCDVLVQNFRPGAVDRMGISYDDVQKVNPGIIYVSSSGYGQSGPNAEDRVYDPVIQCMSGLCTVQARDIAPAPGVPPKAVMLGQAIFDKVTAMTTTQAIVAALYARAMGEGGQHIATNMLDAATYWMWPDCCVNQTWSNPDLPKKTFDVGSLVKGPTPISSIDDVLMDETNRKFLYTGQHALFGNYRAAKFPADFHSTPVAPRPAPPMLGEHTVKILRELNYSQREVYDLLSGGSKAAVVSTRSLLLEKKEAKKAKIFQILERLQGGAHTFAHSPVQKLFQQRHTSCNEPSSRSRRTKRGASFRNEQLSELYHGPLAAVKVLELSSLVAGPLAASILGDQGAEIVKVEHAGKPDASRLVGPSPGKQMGAMYATINRNKRAVALDTSTVEGIEVLTRLARNSDIIFIDSDPESPLSMDILPYSKVKEINKDCIYISIAKEDGELVCQARGGICSLQKDVDGNLSHINTMVVEKATALYAAAAATAGLLARKVGRGGQLISIDMRCASLHFSFPDIFWSNVWEKPGFVKSFPTINECYQLQTSTDGVSYFCIALSDKEWNSFVDIFVDKYKIIDMPEEKRKRWEIVTNRLPDLNSVWDCVKSAMQKLEYKVFSELALEAELINGPVQTIDDLLNSKQSRHNSQVRTIEAPASLGQQRLPVFATIFSQTPVSIRSPAPLFGQDTEAVLIDLGYDDESIAKVMSQFSGSSKSDYTS